MNKATPEQLIKTFTTYSYTDSIKGKLRQLEDCYDFLIENLSSSNENSEILHQLLEVIELLEMQIIKDITPEYVKEAMDDLKCYVSDRHEGF